MKVLIIWVLLSLVFALAWWRFNSACFGHYEITDDKAIRAIVGEYAVEDEYGMRLIAHAIRNRGTLAGVYGVYAKHNKHESKKIWELASLAWFESANEKDISQGADSWYSKQDYAKLGIPEGKDTCYIYGNTIFFKSTKHRR